MTDTDARDLIQRLADELETYNDNNFTSTIEILSEARAYLDEQASQTPKYCWLDDEPGIKPTPCVFDDPNEVRENCCYAMKIDSKWDCAYYGVQERAAQAS
jgi:hypothetical protein